MHDYPTNYDRAEWAHEALRWFAGQTGQIRSGDFEHDLPTVIGDLLCDLCHLCDREGIDFDAALEKGRSGYVDDLEEEADDA